MLSIKNLCHTYRSRKEPALKNISLEIKRGENVVIIGPSGSGKSTLLRCINRLIEPSFGSITINNKNILNHKEAKEARGKIGMIFQNYNLVESETVIKNVLNGRLKYTSTLMTILNRFSKKDYKIARENLNKVELLNLENEVISNLSGGQKQRVGIARALSQNPELILADEPVSSLDPKLMLDIMDLLRRVCKERELTSISTLHFLDFAKRYASRIIGVRDGKIVFDGAPDRLTKEAIGGIYGSTNIF